jgi:uncharacterized RDD family membrane protein YckC
MPRRLGARLLDGVILSVALSLLFVAVIVVAAVTGSLEDINFDEQGELLSGEAVLGFMVLSWMGLALLVTLGYEIGLIAVWGATPGKQIVGIKVVRERDGLPPGWGLSLLRWVIPLLGTIFFLIGQFVVYLSPFFDASGRNQGWHDKVAKTVVIRT